MSEKKSERADWEEDDDENESDILSNWVDFFERLLWTKLGSNSEILLLNQLTHIILV